jgi:anhydro-N-acetylmuramic acid kinase
VYHENLAGGRANVRVIGLMSGTSLDGIDAALVEFADGMAESARPAEAVPEWRLSAFHTEAYPAARREQIHDAIVRGGVDSLCTLHADLGEWFAEAVLALCERAGIAPDAVDLIGCHGQTVWHRPPAQARRGATLQLGCAATLAERTGIAVVNDFRARDVAAGGHGAPLVPWVDSLLFALPGKRRALQNIGGMANVTWVPARGEPHSPLAFDTGPGVALIDAAVQLATGGAESFDRDGLRGRRGTPLPELLQELLAHEFFDLGPPKSTGREAFGRPLVENLVRRVAPATTADWDDLIATLTALSARSIALAYRRWVLPLGVDEIVLTGGGARNPALRELLERELAPVPVLPGEVLGIDPDAKEALAFATLAWAFVHRLPANVPEATGAAHPCVLGSYTPGSEGGHKDG